MNMAAGVKDFPFQSILVTCPACHMERRYLPSEVILGKTNYPQRKIGAARPVQRRAKLWPIWGSGSATLIDKDETLPDRPSHSPLD
jgi:hypothetical protein